MHRNRKLEATVRLIAFATLGVFLGFVGARVIFVGSWLSLIPWALACMLNGLTANTWRATLLSGAVFGFALVFAFLLFGYQGKAPIAREFLPFGILSIIGGACGVAGSTVGHLIRTHIPRAQH